MPDVKLPPPCDYPSSSSGALSASSPAGCSSPLHLRVDMEPCIANLALSPDPLNSLSRHRPFHAPSYPLMARCNSSTLLTNLRYCSSRQGALGVERGLGMVQGSCINTGSNGSRPYRSMENLNWNTIADYGLCALSAAPCRSLDSEFILRYTSSSHWYDGPPDGSLLGAHGLVPNPESLAFFPQHGLPRKDLPLIPQLLLPIGVDEWDTRKELREKLRLQSSRSSLEHLRPLPMRPQMSPNAVAVEREGVHRGTSTGACSRPPCMMRTSPEEIKQEVLRRLQLRRQNSSPNLTIQSSSSSPKIAQTSYTTDNIAGNPSGTESTCKRRRPPVGRLYIPTFEEFKRMRQREGKQSGESTAVVAQHDLRENDGSLSNRTEPPLEPSGFKKGNSEGEEGGNAARNNENLQTFTSTEKPALIVLTTDGTSASTLSCSSVSSRSSPIRTGPSPRSPLQPQACTAKDKAVVVGGDDGSTRRRRSSLEPAGSVPFPASRENWARPSSCCPALLLEGTDLSKYGAKIYKMKDGLIGSALDLIKKRLVMQLVQIYSMWLI